MNVHVFVVAPKCTNSSTFSSKPIMKSKKIKPSSLLEATRYCCDSWGNLSDQLGSEILLDIGSIEFSNAILHPPKFNIVPKEWCLEDYFLIAKVTFQGYVQLQNISRCMKILAPLSFFNFLSQPSWLSLKTSVSKNMYKPCIEEVPTVKQKTQISPTSARLLTFSKGPINITWSLLINSSFARNH